MKHIFGIIILLFPLILFAQDELDNFDGAVAQRIRARRAAFITDQLQLTPEQSQNFWPIYNQFDALQNKLRRSTRINRGLGSMTDEEIEVFIQKRLDAEQELLDAKIEYFKKLKTVISARQIAKLFKAEREFKTSLLRELQQKRKGRN